MSLGRSIAHSFSAEPTSYGDDYLDYASMITGKAKLQQLKSRNMNRAVNPAILIAIIKASNHMSIVGGQMHDGLWLPPDACAKMKNPVNRKCKRAAICFSFLFSREKASKNSVESIYAKVRNILVYGKLGIALPRKVVRKYVSIYCHSLSCQQKIEFEPYSPR